jgi:polygalacturonase
MVSFVSAWLGGLLMRALFDVRAFGAKGDGKTIDTGAIQQALDASGKAGGGIVRLKPGTYLSQPIYLRDKTTLQLDAGAKLLATDEPAHFMIRGNRSRAWHS